MSDVASGEATEPDDEREVLEGEGGAVVISGPFGGLTSKEAAARSVEVRRQNALERLRDAELTKQAAQLKIKNAPAREELKGAAAAVLFDIAEKILAGDIPVRNAREASSVIDSFFNVLRLESGQSTANVEHLTFEDKMNMVREMQAAARDRQAVEVAPTEP